MRGRTVALAGSRRGGRDASEQRGRAAVQATGDLVLHGLRHSGETEAFLPDMHVRYTAAGRETRMSGTVAVMAGLSLPEVQKLLRHRNVTTTTKYIHLAEASQLRLQDRAMAAVMPTAILVRK
jgi:integrase